MKQLKTDLNSKDENHQENTLRNALKQVLDQDLRNEMKSDLEVELGIKRDGSDKSLLTKSAGMNRRKFIRWSSGIAASLLIFIAAYFAMIYTEPDLNSLATSYAQAEVPTHPGLTKGIVDQDETYTQATLAFNQKKWNNAADLFARILPSTAESIYYQALALFKSDKYDLAYEKFSDEILDNTVYEEEIKWYSALSLILSGKSSDGITILKSITEGEWRYDEAVNLIHTYE